MCLESLKQSQTVTVDCCKKQFHANCYISAMNVNPTCPLCRKEQVVIQMPVPVQAPQFIIIDQTIRIRRVVNIIVIMFGCGVLSYFFSINNKVPLHNP